MAERRKKVRLQDIAEAVGTSTVTVSNALNGKTGMSPELRAQITEKAKAMGYPVKKENPEPKLIIRNTDYIESLAIGVVVSKFYISVGTSFYWEIYQQIVKKASSYNAFTMIEIIDEENMKPGQLPKCVTSGKNNAIIILGKMNVDFIRNIINYSKVPVLTLDYYNPSLSCDSVLSDNEGGMYLTTKYLIDNGHRDIAFVGDTSENGNFRERLMGYEDALKEAGIPMREEWILNDRISDLGRAALKLPKEMPTAFACSGDYSAGILYNELCAKGLKVPEDVSVSSYDDFLFGNPFGRHLTTFHVPMDRMASDSVKILRQKIVGTVPVNNFIRIHLPGYMVIRDSVKNMNEE